MIISCLYNWLGVDRKWIFQNLFWLLGPWQKAVPERRKLFIYNKNKNKLLILIWKCLVSPCRESPTWTPHCRVYPGKVTLVALQGQADCLWPCSPAHIQTWSLCTPSQLTPVGQPSQIFFLGHNSLQVFVTLPSWTLHSNKPGDIA